jgi:hypothetical protein
VKLSAYRCDRCGEWVEELKVTHALVNLKGRRTGRYVQDLCEACTEKVMPSETEPAIETHITLPTVGTPRGRKRNPEEVAEALAVGRAMLADGKSVSDVRSHLGVSVATWNRWMRWSEVAQHLVQHQPEVSAGQGL